MEKGRSKTPETLESYFKRKRVAAFRFGYDWEKDIRNIRREVHLLFGFNLTDEQIRERMSGVSAVSASTV